ncbi:MAG: type IV pilin N-terminal domain-containing protein, partial [Methanoregula sp.]|nr:type IV pilin N-terminal domain-containing protein [Methanoregula sp.]
MTMEQTDRMEHDKNCRNRESGVSEIIGAVLLIALVVTAIAIVGVGMLSQPLPEKIPAVDAIISTSGRDIQITHNGGDTLQKDEMVILVDGQDQTANFLKVGCSSWQSLSPGESLTVSYPNKPDNVRIVYKGAGASSVVSSAIFGEAGQPIAPYMITASAVGSGTGTISPSGSVPVFFREDKTFTISQNVGSILTDVSVDGSSVGNVTTYTFLKVVASHTISATFASDTFTITPSVSGGNGTVSPATVQTVNYGATPTFTFAPATGYYLNTVT